MRRFRLIPFTEMTDPRSAPMPMRSCPGPGRGHRQAAVVPAQPHR